MRRIIVITGLVGLVLSACQSGGQLRQIAKGEELAFYNFSTPASFEEGSYGGAATLRVINGVYRIDVRVGDNTLWWGQWGETYSDVVVEVDAAQITERPETTYGVMCRVRGTLGQPREVDPELAAIMEAAPLPSDEVEATEEAVTPEEAVPTAETEVEATEVPDDAEEAEAADDLSLEPAFTEGDGYLFLIQGTGSYSIRRASGRNIVPLVDWTASDHINTAPGRNHIRAICAGDYLALYVNDQFLADTTDDAYSSGQVGLAASAANQLGVRVDFDNLTVSEAQTG